MMIEEIFNSFKNKTREGIRWKMVGDMYKRIDYIAGQCLCNRITPHNYSFISNTTRHGFRIKISATLYFFAILI